MRAHDKKKFYRRMIKDFVKKGQIPTADGKWVKYDSTNTTHRHMFFGHGGGR